MVSIAQETEWAAKPGWTGIKNYAPTPAGSPVGIATGYGLDGPGIESRWVRDFSQMSRPVLGTNQASCTMGTGSFPGADRAGRGADHTPPSSSEVENE
jgi:hypothetical protein